MNLGWIPRLDVGGGALGATLAYVLERFLEAAGVFDFASLTAAVLAAIVFGVGYVFKGNLKSVATAIAAYVAVVVAYLVAPLIGVPQDDAALSTAVVALFQALIVYLARAQHPDAPPVPRNVS